MNTGEDIQGLRKILDFTRLISIAVLCIHFYQVCYQVFKMWGWTAGITDRLLANIVHTALFDNPWSPKFAALLFLCISLIGVTGKKDEKIERSGIITYMVTGLICYFISILLLYLPLPLKPLAVSYIGITALGYLIIMEWEANYPFTKYCRSIGIDVIPLQQSFGHVEYILKHYRYAELREDDKDYSQINPLKEEEANALFTYLFKDMIRTHSSPYIHIGGDETYLLGHSESSKDKVRKLGMVRLYGDYIKMICDIVVSLGKRPVLWADIAMKYPEALKSLPKQTVLVDWNYGWELNRFGDHEKLMSC